MATAVALLAVARAGSAAAAPTITEYNTGLPGNAAPLSIVPALDGNLWLTQNGGTSAIDKITASGVIASYPTEGTSAPREMTLGPDGNLWFTESGGAASIGTVDPQTGKFNESSLPGGSNPVGITGGPEGDVWFTEGGGNAMIGRMAPSNHELTEFSVPTKGSKPAEITVGPEGDLWFTESTNPGAIGRLDPKTKVITEFSTGLTPNGKPWGITAGPEGNIWFTESVSPGRIGRINPTSGAITEFSTGLTVGAPQNIVTGRDGNLYFTESNGTGALGQITPTGLISEHTEGLTSNSKPWGITSGPDGNIWFVENANPAKVGKLTLAASMEPPTTGIPAGQLTTGLVAAPQPPGASRRVSVSPVLGRLAAIQVLSGAILVRDSSGTFVPLSGTSTVPIGSEVDARHGVLRLLTALNNRGGAQSAIVWGGIFQVRQSRSGNGMTSLILRGAPLPCARRGRAQASLAKSRGSKKHTLWVKDQNGRYSTYGANSVATVLGTRWETVETCAGTLTRVDLGRVRIRDLRRGVTIVVRAGHSYLARS